MENENCPAVVGEGQAVGKVAEVAYTFDGMPRFYGVLHIELPAGTPLYTRPAALAPEAHQPKLVLALPDYEKRRIVIASDEVIDGERLVCVAIKAAPEAPTAAPPACMLNEAQAANLDLVIARLEQISGNFTDDYRTSASEALVCAKQVRAELKANTPKAAPVAEAPTELTPDRRAAIHAKVLSTIGDFEPMIGPALTPPTLSNDEIDCVTSAFKQADHHDSIRACIAAAFAAPATEQANSIITVDLRQKLEEAIQDKVHAAEDLMTDNPPFRARQRWNEACSELDKTIGLVFAAQASPAKPDLSGLTALKEIEDRLALIYRVCCGLAPKQAIGEGLHALIELPEWATIRSLLVAITKEP